MNKMCGGVGEHLSTLKLESGFLQRGYRRLQGSEGLVFMRDVRRGAECWGREAVSKLMGQCSDLQLSLSRHRHVGHLHERGWGEVTWKSEVRQACPPSETRDLHKGFVKGSENGPSTATPL